MKNILALLLIAGLGWEGYKYSQKLSVTRLYDTPYVVVYGRNSCSITKSTMKQLTKLGIPFEYEIIDEPEVADFIHDRMTASGISIRRYNLPVVDVNGEIFIRPRIPEIQSAYL